MTLPDPTELKRAEMGQSLKDIAALTRITRLPAVIDGVPTLDDNTRERLEDIRDRLQARYDAWARDVRAAAAKRMGR